MSNIEFKYKDKVYQAFYRSDNSCTGCAFEYVPPSCSEPMDDAETQTGRRCFVHIWQEKKTAETADTAQQQTELTWTLQEIETWYTEWIDENFGEVKEGLLEVKRKFALKQDPEYQKYLELKAKFGE